MTYDDLKEFGGRRYTGMAVGGKHVWRYPDGVWSESKVTPDMWDFTFTSLKKREAAAPSGSGAAIHSRYHWYILAHQKVRKVDKDTYQTFMEGVKHKIAHRRPHWSMWSSEYPDQPSARQKVISILELALERLRQEETGFTRALDDFDKDNQSSGLGVAPLCNGSS